jgi:diguanylate cyclase (GGDEF)-like protein/hemerythrin-like metal-binding protein
LCRLAQAAVLLYVWRIHRSYIPARDWAIGSLTAVPGLLLLGLRDFIPDWASVVAANGSVLLGWMIFDFGLMRAAGRRPPWRCGFTLCGLAVALIAWFSLVKPDYPSRLVISSAAIILFDALAAASCLTRSSNGMETTLRLIGLVLATHMLSCLWRTFGVATAAIPSLLTPALSQIQYSLAGILGTMVVTALVALLTSQNLQKELREQARSDPLTKACNRRTLDEVVACQWPSAARNSEPLSCLMLDIDHFKRFNDRYGHQAGDAALVAVSSAARTLLRAEDTWCRFGGEEFLAILPRTDAAQALIVAERLRVRIAAIPLDGPEEPRRVTVSIGVANARTDTMSWTELVGRCDRALYLAKEKGRNRVELAGEASEAAVGAGFVRLAWREAYACGREPIDEQHRRLFEITNDLLAALLAGRPKAACQECIHTLLADVEKHFHDEEAIIRAAEYPGAEAHAAIHRELMLKARMLAEKYDQDVLTVGEMFDYLARDIVSRHLLVEDRKFFPFLRQRGRTETPRRG